MAFSHAIASTSFAMLCCLGWLITGGSGWSALGLYLFAGQAAFISLLGRSALSHWLAARQS